MEIPIKRSRRKTLSLVVTRDGKPVVHAPYHVSEKEIEAFVERHRVWLMRKIAERSVEKPDFRDGSRVEIEGILRTVCCGKPKISGESLFLPQEGREVTLIKLLKNLTRTRMERITRTIAERYGYKYEGVRISSTRGRWGSCSAKGRISYTFRSAFLPDELAYYLAAHELAHTKVFNHSPSFWWEVERVVESPKNMRSKLRKYAWALEIL